MAKQQGQPAGGAQVPLSLTQRGFAGGELGPQLLGRADQEKYATGLQLCRNMQIERHGAVVNRAGTLYAGNAANQSAACRLRPFMYDSFNGYLLEIQTGYCRVWAAGAPLSASSALNFSPIGYTPPGSIVKSGGALWYATNEQFNLPITITLSGTYVAGSLVTLTASAALWTASMCQTNAVVTMLLPGTNGVHVTLSAYTSTTVVAGTVDVAVPTGLQATATMLWMCRQATFGISYLGDVAHLQAVAATTITITTGSNYNAGTTLILTANQGFFSNEMVTQATVISMPSVLGTIQITVTGYTSGTVAAGVANLGIPVALQATATAVFSIPQSAGFSQFSALGPTWTPDTTFPPNSPTIAISTSSTFASGQTLTLTASGNMFTAGMAAGNYGVTIHDGLGNTITPFITAYSSATSVSALCAVSIPQNLQNVATSFWSIAQVAPVAGAFWYQLTSTQVEFPLAIAQSALSSLVTSQFTNIMTITHQSLWPVRITRSSALGWQVQCLLPTPTLAPPTGLLATAGFGPPSGSTLHTFSYFVTSVASDGQESLASNPVTCLGNYPSGTLPNIIQWQPVAGAISYNVYGTASASASTTVPGFLGSSSVTSFNDMGGLPNVANQPPATIPQFQTTGDYPAVTSYFQQRLLFANSANHPQRAWASQTQNLINFTVVTPTAASGAITFDVPGQLIQPITSLVDIQKLVLHTASNEYICTGDITGAITPTGINAVFQGAAGCALVQPVRVGITDIFVQARGGQIRDLMYTIQSTSYQGKDLTIFNPQLFLGQTVTDMAWQNIKDSIIWCLMGSGQLYGLTYIREHEIWAWHHHDTGGTAAVTTATQGGTGIVVVQTPTVAVGNDLIESIAVVPEGQSDTLYLEVSRTINGATVRSIERMANREFVDQAALSDAVFSDCSLIYDGRNTGATTMTITGSFAYGALQTVTASVPTFSAGWVGQAVVFQQYNAANVLIDQVIITVNTYSSTTVITGYPNKAVPAWAQVALTTWGHAVSSFTGATNLAGASVSVLADGNVVASPLNPAYTSPVVVSGGGAFTLPVNALVVCVGLPYLAQLQTMPLENLQGETLTNKMQVVNEVTPMFYATRGGFWGMDFQHLFQWNQRNAEPLSSPVSLFTGPARIPIQATWEITGTACRAQLDPLPIGIEAP